MTAFLLVTGCGSRERTAWFAQLGVAEAQFAHAETLTDPPSHEHADWQEAARWYRKAADQGHQQARLRLAWLLIEGLGVERDDLAAERLLNGLVAQGVEEAHPLRDEVRRRIVEEAQRADRPAENVTPRVAL